MRIAGGWGDMRSGARSLIIGKIISHLLGVLELERE